MFSSSVRRAGRPLAASRAVRSLTTSRSLATASVLSPIQTTTLANGLTVATQSIPSVSTANVAVYVDTGSRAENATNNGIAHFLEHLLFKGTNRRSQHRLEREVENLGAQLNAYTLRENTCYWAKCMARDVDNAVDVLADIVTRLVYPPTAIETERSVILQEYELVQGMTIEVLFDDLHEVAYPKHPLGYTILGPVENIRKLAKPQFTEFVRLLYKGDRMAVIATGQVDHAKFVAEVASQFGHVPALEYPTPLGASSGALPEFVGGDRRTRDMRLKETFVVLAVEGCAWKDPDYAVLMVAQTMIGTWERTQGVLLLLDLVVTAASGNRGRPLANQFLAFSTNYKDTGMWGVYFMADINEDLTPMVNGVLFEWAKLRSGKFSASEVEAAKDVLKGKAIQSLDNNEQVGELIGRSIMSSGRAIPPEETLQQIARVTPEDVQRWAKQRLWQKPVAVSAIGNTDGMVPHEYIEAGMEMML